MSTTGAGQNGSVVDRSLTRRGWAALGLAGGCLVVSVLFGARGGALNAVVLAMVVTVLAAVVTTRRATAPPVERRLPPDDAVGAEGEVALEFDPEVPVTGVVEDTVAEGLDAEGATRETTVADEPLTYTVRYRDRGVHEVGPLSVTAADVLGLARVRFEYAGVDALTVYPRVYELRGMTRSRLVALAGDAPDREREEFDRVREYDPGDDLRDVHWRTSAKRPGEDLVVKEFLAEDEVDTVAVAVESTADDADQAAEVAASVAAHLLSAGLEVRLDTPDHQGGTAVAGPAGRRAVLERLAVFDGGTLTPGARDADVHVDAREDPVVRVGRTETTPEALLATLDGSFGASTDTDTDTDPTDRTPSAARAVPDGGQGGDRP